MVDKKKSKSQKIAIKSFNPEKYVDVTPTIDEAKKNSIVISFGRMNPITTGHEKLVNAVLKEATKRRSQAAIYMSHSQDKKKNPLSYDQKIELGQKAFGQIIKRSNARTIIEVAKELSGKYNDLVVVVGSDRVDDFKKLLDTYNGREYNFENIEVVSAGERDPDADDVTGMSASKLRGLAASGDMEQFRKGLPKKLQSSAEKVYDMVRSAMGVNEELDEETLVERPVLSLAQRRKRGIVMRRYKTKIAAAKKRARRRKASPEKLMKRARIRAIDVIRQRLMRGKKYSEMEPAEKVALDKRLAKVPARVIDRIARKLLPQVRKAELERLQRELGGVEKKESFDINESFNAFVEARTIKPQDPDVSHLPGSQPKGYYAGVKKSVKDDRARHFAKYSKKSDDVQSSYKPAPGDAGAKTRPSVHTKKFKDMFGESLQEASLADTQVRKRPHMAMEKNGSVKFDKRFKIFKKQINESDEYLGEELSDLVNLMLDMDAFIMSEEFDALMESNPEEALKKKAEKSGISYGILKKVFDRGVAAWRTGHRPGTTPTQWGLARVNSFATKGKGTWGKADSDLAAKVRNEATSPTAVHPFVHVKDPNKAVKVSADLKHKLGVGLTMKHMLQHGIRAKDIDNDGDVDKFEKGTPDEITGTEKKNLTRVMQKKLSGETKHSRVGHAFESTEIFTLDERFELSQLNESEMMTKIIEKMHKYVMQGIDPGQIAADMANLIPGVGSGRQLEKAYVAAYGTPKKQSAGSHSTLLKKYGFKESIDKTKPSNREHGTDSLVKILKSDTPGEGLKESSPLMKDLPRGSRVRFQYRTMVGDNRTVEGTVIGTEAYSHEGSSDVVSSRGRLRVRDDEGKLYIVKHEDADRIK